MMFSACHFAGLAMGVMSKMVELGCLYTNRGVLYGPPLLYLIGNQKNETWMALLADIYHPGSSHVNFVKQDLRENEGGRSSKRETKSESKSKSEREK